MLYSDTITEESQARTYLISAFIEDLFVMPEQIGIKRNQLGVSISPIAIVYFARESINRRSMLNN